MNKKDLIICFDLDDTLIDDSYKFEITFCDCIKVILESFETRAPQIDEVLQLARKIDNENMEKWPMDQRYTPLRLKDTWLETYATMCDQYNVPQKPHIEMILEGLVRKNYDPPYYIIPGAIETLTSLQQANYCLHLITVGTADIQLRKISVSGLSKFFQSIQIAEDGDKTAKLKALADAYGKENIVMIGNSLRSDINPALSLGIKVVYIPRGSWHQFKAEPLNQKYIAIPEISDLPAVIKQMLAN